MNNSLVLKFVGEKINMFEIDLAESYVAPIKRVEILTSTPRHDFVVIISNFFQHELV